jgi:hypothetical protein
MTHGGKGLAVLALAGAAFTAAPALASGSHSAHIYQRAERLISAEHVRVPWDGRYSIGRHGLCIETFNGTRRDIRQFGHGLPAGFFLKVCQDRSYVVRDGAPFADMAPFGSAS